jgi:hypothetical protein
VPVLHQGVPLTGFWGTGRECGVTQFVVDALDNDTFFEDYFQPGRPVLVRGAVSAWGTPPPWRFDWLTERFAHHRVPLYDTLFGVTGVTTFARYVERYTASKRSSMPPYLRWFVRQHTGDLPWSDEAFRELESDWRAPAWLPDSDFVFPRFRHADPVRDGFPGKGLFVCGRGGRTRLHTDPWATDAVLWQTTGTKRVTLYSPDAGHLLARDGAVVDLEKPDDERFPRWRSAVPVIDEVLQPGDMLFIASGWYHAAVALEDSVSLTWNFVHATHQARFDRYLKDGGGADRTVEYFLSVSPG